MNPVLVTLLACVFSFIFGFKLCKKYYKVELLLSTIAFITDMISQKYTDEQVKEKIEKWKEQLRKEGL